MSYFTTCQLCGANLDPGEKCDCKKEERPPSHGEAFQNSEPKPSTDIQSIPQRHGSCK